MTNHRKLDPSATALLMMDYQVGLLRRIRDASTLLDRVNAAVAEVGARGGHIGWVRMGLDDNDFAAIPSTSAMAHTADAKLRATLHAQAADSQIHERLSPQPHDIAVRKTRVGAFTTTDLDRQLHDLAVTTVILAGISTAGVVLSTMREALDRDYRIIVLNDASADPDRGTHDFLISKIFPRHASVINVDSLSRLWTQQRVI